MILLLLSILINDPIDDLKPGNYYFTAEWCRACKKQKPVIKELEKRGYKFTTFDYDDDQRSFKKYKVKSMPYFIIVNEDVIRLKGRQSLKKLQPLLHKEDDGSTSRKSKTQKEYQLFGATN